MSCEFKPCPFCGSEDITIHFIRGQVSIGCRTDGCMGQWWRARAYNDKERAITAWNTRHGKEN